MGEKRNRYRFKRDKTAVEVFRTSTGHFRAWIEQGDVRYAVTVGGMMWHEGKGRKYEKEIKKRCKNILDDLVHEYKGAFGEDYHFQD